MDHSDPKRYQEPPARGNKRTVQVRTLIQQTGEQANRQLSSQPDGGNMLTFR